MQDGATVITIAAVLYVLTGIAYSIGTIPATRYLIRNRRLPVFGRIRLYEGGFFDRRGIDAVIWASLAFIVLGVLFVVVGFWLWKGMRIGGIAAFVLFPAVMLVSIGSLAPIPWVLEPAKLVLVLLGWGSLE